MAEAEKQYEEEGTGHRPGTDPALCQKEGSGGLCIFAGYLPAARAGILVHL